MACAIVLVCLGLCVQQVPPLLNKLRLTEALMNLPAQTWPQVEALALTGGLATLAPVEPKPVGNFRYGNQDAQAVAVGLQRDGQTELRLGMRLALQEQGLAWHALPVCGLRQAPAGWRSLAEPLASGIPIEQLLFICSNR